MGTFSTFQPHGPLWKRRNGRPRRNDFALSPHWLFPKWPNLPPRRQVMLPMCHFRGDAVPSWVPYAVLGLLVRSWCHCALTKGFPKNQQHPIRFEGNQQNMIRKYRKCWESLCIYRFNMIECHCQPFIMCQNGYAAPYHMPNQEKNTSFWVDQGALRRSQRMWFLHRMHVPPLGFSVKNLILSEQLC